MRLKELPKHRQSRRPHFKRWSSIAQRCFNENCVDWNDYGGRGISLCWRWHPVNPSGVKNFIAWVEYELNRFWEKHPSRKGEKFEVARKDVNGHFSPKNCHIVFQGESAQTRRFVTMTLEDVVKMRRYKRTHPKAMMQELCALFPFDHMAIYRALRGFTWKAADAQELPLPAWSKTALLKQDPHDEDPHSQAPHASTAGDMAALEA